MVLKNLWVILCFCGLNAEAENSTFSPVRNLSQKQPLKKSFQEATLNLNSDIKASLVTPNTIADLQSMPSQVQLSASNVSGTEDGATTITLTATTTDPVIGNQSVVLTITGTNITTSDYTLDGLSQNNFMITIADGQTSGSVSLMIINDSEEEGPELLAASIINPTSGLILGNINKQFIEILDNDLTFGLLNRSIIYNRSSMITIGGDKSLKNLGMLKGSGIINAKLLNTGVLSPGNSN